MASYVLYLSAFLLAIGTASALRCYACSGFACGYGFLSFTYPEVDCEIKSGNSFIDTVASIVPSQCVKVVGVDESGSNFIARNCSTYTGETACKLLVGALELGSNMKDVQCYTCTDNLCNSAPKFTGMAAIGLIIACFAFLF